MKSKVAQPSAVQFEYIATVERFAFILKMHSHCGRSTVRDYKKQLKKLKTINQ